MKYRGKILIFAGTTEGRTLAGCLTNHGYEVVVSTATEYGAQLLIEDESLTVWSQRMNQQQMIDSIVKNRFDAVIDATHPYATEVTQNIKMACEDTNTPYHRLLREEQTADDVLFVSSIEEAVSILEKTSGNVMLTTGVKELQAFSVLTNFSQRVYARVLPCEDSIQACNKYGLIGKHIIAMQGPFSQEMNAAMLSQIQASYMVTKSSGRIGGFLQKVEAAKELGVTTVVIGRPLKESGYSFSELLEKFGVQLTQSQHEPAEFFPFFVSIKNKKVLVVGGGTIATRRIKTLKQFSCHVTVKALCISNELKNLCDKWEEGCVTMCDCDGKDFVIAATNDPQLNHAIVRYCHENKIPVNRVDNKEECDFYFPAVVINPPLVAGICADGKDHHNVKKAADFFRRTSLQWNEKIGN